jgi:hypothetical protein
MEGREYMQRTPSAYARISGIKQNMLQATG